MMEKMSDMIEKRLESIEDILKMLLINNVLGCSEEQTIQSIIIDNAKELLREIDIANIRLNYIEGKYYLFADVQETATLSNIKRTYSQAQTLFTDMKIVFSFRKLHPKRKKALFDAGISFCTHNGELMIF